MLPVISLLLFIPLKILGLTDWPWWWCFSGIYLTVLITCFKLTIEELTGGRHWIWWNPLTVIWWIGIFASVILPILLDPIN